MKSFVLLVLSGLLLADSALAGPEQIIKQRAKEQVQQSNVRQGVAPPTQTPMPSGSVATPVPQISTSLTYFSSGLGAIKPDAPATADQKQRLSQQLIASAQGAKPSLTKSSGLVDKLTASQAEKALSTSSRARLVQELDAILNPYKYPQAKPDGIYSDIQAIFQENGLSRNKAVAIANDVKAIGSEIQQGGAR